MSAESLKQAIESNNLDATRQILESKPDLDAGIFNWSMPPLAASRSTEMVDLLLDHGATLKAVSEWWKPGFGAHEVEPEIAEYLIGLGVEISPHAAAGIGLTSALVDLLEKDPALVHSRGGDGGQPLHFARSCEAAKILVDHGADLNARDEDHKSTPVQWRIKDSPEVVEYLLKSGAEADIFLAAKIGDKDLARKLIEDNPACTTWRIGHNSGPFPGIGFEGRGGTIYQWTLGFNLTPHEVALKYGQQELYEFLLENTPPKYQFLVACTTANRELAESILAEFPDLISELEDEDKSLVAKFCWETNIDIEAVRLMLDLGFPVDAPEFNHGYTALHNAAWCGDADLVQLLLERDHPLDLRHPEYKATATGFAIHSCTQAKRHPYGQFHQVLELLIDAGVPVDEWDEEAVKTITKK